MSLCSGAEIASYAQGWYTFSNPVPPLRSLPTNPYTPMQNLTITVDDSSSTFIYSPPRAWFPATPLEDANRSSYFQDTTTYTNISQANVTFEFRGNSIQIFGSKSQNHGNFIVQLDDRVFDSLSSHSGPPARFQQQLFAQSGLSSGKHTVVITNMQDGMFFDIDFVTVQSDAGNGDGNVAFDSATPNHFVDTYSPSTNEIRTTDAGGGDGASPSTIAAIILGIIVGLLFFFIALIYYINRGKKLGQFQWNIFSRESWGFTNKTETARRVRREDATEGFELDGGGYAAVMTSEGNATRIDRPGTARSAASATSGDDSEMGLIGHHHRDEISEVVPSPARPNKQRWSFSGLSVLNQPLVIPKSSMGIIGVGTAARHLNIPSTQGGLRFPSSASASVPIPLPPGLAGTSGGAFANSRSVHRQTVLSWKPEPENTKPPPSKAPPPPKTSERSQYEPEGPNGSKETLRSPKKDRPAPLGERPSLRIIHQFGSEGSLPLRSALPEPETPLPPLPPSERPSERSRSPIDQADLLIHRIPTIRTSVVGVERPAVQSATEISGHELMTPTSGPMSERSSTSIDGSRSRPSSFGGGSVSPRSGRERPRSAGSILGPRKRVPKTSVTSHKRGRELGEASGTENDKDKKEDREGEAA